MREKGKRNKREGPDEIIQTSCADFSLKPITTVVRDWYYFIEKIFEEEEEKNAHTHERMNKCEIITRTNQMHLCVSTHFSSKLCEHTSIEFLSRSIVMKLFISQGIIQYSLKGLTWKEILTWDDWVV